MKNDTKKLVNKGTKENPVFIAPEEVSGTSNDYVITRCAVYLLLLAVCVGLLVMSS